MATYFETQRLKVIEVTGELAMQNRTRLVKQIPNILTPTVVANLPPYFKDITNPESADIWLAKMRQESRLFQVTSNTDQAIGFLFVFVDNENSAHIGYLLAEEYWGQGLASELLQCFIEKVVKTESWLKLVGGVDKSNVASIHLLNKLGFVALPQNDNDVLFYEYTIANS